MLPEAEAEGFRAVGRLNIAGTRFCTATLISERLVLTAAHCLYNPRTKERVALEELRFVAGQRPGGFAALREVVGAAVSPGFVYAEEVAPRDVRQDLALIELAEPVAPEEARPLGLGATGWREASLRIVSYARDRPYAPSIQDECGIRSRGDGMLVLGCKVIFGTSGAPVLAPSENGPRLVAVVSAMGRDERGRDVALAVLAETQMQALRAALAAQRRRLQKIP